MAVEKGTNGQKWKLLLATRADVEAVGETVEFPSVFKKAAGFVVLHASCILHPREFTVYAAAVGRAWDLERVLREITTARNILCSPDVALQCPAVCIGVALLHRAERTWLPAARVVESTAS